MTGKEFGEWLDLNGIDVGAAAAYFGVSEGTIYKWRSTPGVPETKTNWVRDRIAKYSAAHAQDTAPERVSLEITREQFADWNRAALLAGKIIYDWAAEVLDEAAAAATLADQPQTGSRDTPNPVALVSEPGNGPASPRLTDAGPASDTASPPRMNGDKIA